MQNTISRPKISAEIAKNTYGKNLKWWQFHILKKIFAVLAIVFLSVSLSAEIRFLEGGHPWHLPEVIDLTNQGTFFASTDFGFVDGKDKRLTYFNLGKTVLGQREERFPAWNPWLSNGGRTLCGITFKKPLKPRVPGMFNHFKDNKVLFDRAVIRWSDHVPEPGAWRACILTTDNKLKRLKTPENKIYPHDRTTINFEPTTIKTFYIALKGGENGKKKNYVGVNDIKLYMETPKLLIGKPERLWTSVFQEDLYMVNFAKKMGLKSDSPRIIEGIQVVNAYCAGRYNLALTWDILSRMIPFIKYKGEKIFPIDKEYITAPKSDNSQDSLTYTLDFKLPEGGECQMLVKMIFKKTDKDHLDFSMSSNNLPQGAKVGFQMFSSSDLFGKFLKKSENGIVKF